MIKKNKIFFTKEEVLLKIEEYYQFYQKRDKEILKSKVMQEKDPDERIDFDKITDQETRDSMFKEFKEQGFDCIYSFCKLENGWVQAIEDCCPYCVKTLVSSYGSRNDRIKFNENTTIGCTLPITKKEKAIAKKEKVKKDKKTQHKLISYRKKNQKKLKKEKYKEIFKLFTKNNINTSRKTLNTINNGLYSTTISSKNPLYKEDDFSENNNERNVKNRKGYRRTVSVDKFLHNSKIESKYIHERFIFYFPWIDFEFLYTRCSSNQNEILEDINKIIKCQMRQKNKEYKLIESLEELNKYKLKK